MLGNIQFRPTHYDKHDNNVYNSVCYRQGYFPIISLLEHYSKVSVFKVLLDQDTGNVGILLMKEETMIQTIKKYDLPKIQIQELQTFVYRDRHCRKG